MKKLLLLLVSIVFLCSCEPDHPKDYLSFSGKLENVKDTSLYITGFGVRKLIKINDDGSFSDSLKVTKADMLTMFIPRNGRAYVYLDNGYDLNVTGDADNFFKSFTYKGNSIGAQTNNLIIEQYNYGQTAGNARGFYILEKDAFNKKIADFKNGMDSIADKFPKADPSLIKKLDDQNNSFFSELEKNYDQAHPIILEQERMLAKLQPGQPAPEFNNYEDINGGTKSLKDFRGNFVYIDIWATWCQPCLAQIPSLKKLEKDLEGQNISIVSISTDDSGRSGGSWEKAHDKWSKMVKDRNMSGFQLWAGQDDARFSKEYLVTTIPRFILIDPEGKIVDHEAMRPTDPNIKRYLKEAGVK